MSEPARDYRCESCHKLLFRGVIVEGSVEIKCRSCHAINTITGNHMVEYLCAFRTCPYRIAPTPAAS